MVTASSDEKEGRKIRRECSWPPAGICMEQAMRMPIVLSILIKARRLNGRSWEGGHLIKQFNRADIKVLNARLKAVAK
jgi:hypothetical protein